jgi:hypothetical protein
LFTEKYTHSSTISHTHTLTHSFTIHTLFMHTSDSNPSTDAFLTSQKQLKEEGNPSELHCVESTNLPHSVTCVWFA